MMVLILLLRTLIVPWDLDIRMAHQGFFQALCHTNVFVFRIEFGKGQRPFLTPKT